MLHLLSECFDSRIFHLCRQRAEHSRLRSQSHHSTLQATTNLSQAWLTLAQARPTLAQVQVTLTQDQALVMLDQACCSVQQLYRHIGLRPWRFVLERRPMPAKCYPSHLSASIAPRGRAHSCQSSVAPPSTSPCVRPTVLKYRVWSHRRGANCAVRPPQWAR